MTLQRTHYRRQIYLQATQRKEGNIPDPLTCITELNLVCAIHSRPFPPQRNTEIDIVNLRLLTDRIYKTRLYISSPQHRNETQGTLHHTQKGRKKMTYLGILCIICHRISSVISVPSPVKWVNHNII